MKKFAIASFVLIVIILILLAGCAKKAENKDKNQKESEEVFDLTNIKTLKDLLALRKEIYCETVNTEKDEKLKYYVKSNKYRVEGIIGGDQTFIILNPDDGYKYIKPSSPFPPQVQCEWIKYREEIENLVEDQVEHKLGYEDALIDQYKWKCYIKPIDDSLFIPPPNACDFLEILRNFQQNYTFP